MGTMWDDAAITAKVKKALVDAYDIKARRVDVDTLDGVVTMTGVVETETGYRRAEELAGAVEGVRTVTNLLQVGSKTFGQALDDKVIGTKIKAKLISEPEIKSLHIDVDVDRAVATLTGTVENREQRTRVLDIARSVSGVAKVIDNLKVVNP
jgi:hyperosmotically inducible protein